MTELMFLSSMAMLCICTLGQSHNIVEAAAADSHQLGPLGPNPLALQADPNFLRFGRSSSPQMEFGFGDQLMDGTEKRAPGAQSANFLRFGKAAPEPNFLRFGRTPGAAKRLNNNNNNKGAAGATVEPSLIRFGRSGGKANNFLRFGRASDAELLAMEEEAFERQLRQPNPNFLRFG